MFGRIWESHQRVRDEYCSDFPSSFQRQARELRRHTFDRNIIIYGGGHHTIMVYPASIETAHTDERLEMSFRGQGSFHQSVHILLTRSDTIDTNVKTQISEILQKQEAFCNRYT